MSDKTGGPAFPGERVVYRAGYATKETEPVAGMTLRDYYKAHAPITVSDAITAIESTGEKTYTGIDIMNMLCDMRGFYADEMIKERAK